MKSNSITFKLISFIIFAFIIITISIVNLAKFSLTKIIYNNQKSIFTERVDTIIKKISNNEERLKKTGLIEAYIEDFKNATINTLRKTYYTKKNQEIYPFIVDNKGIVILHPVLPTGSTDLQQNKDLIKILLIKSGDFSYTYKNEKKWCLFKNFTCPLLCVVSCVEA